MFDIVVFILWKKLFSKNIKKLNAVKLFSLSIVKINLFLFIDNEIGITLQTNIYINIIIHIGK